MREDNLPRGADSRIGTVAEPPKGSSPFPWWQQRGAARHRAPLSGCAPLPAAPCARCPLVPQERGTSGKGTLAGNSGWCSAVFAATIIRNVLPGFWRVCLYVHLRAGFFLVFPPPCYFFLVLQLNETSEKVQLCL